MATYTFTFPAAAAGKSVSIRNAADEEVDTATAGVADGVQGPVVVTANLPVGSYTAEATDTSIFFTSRAKGVLDAGASLAFSSLVGAVDGATGTALQAILDDIAARVTALETP